MFNEEILVFIIMLLISFVFLLGGFLIIKFKLAFLITFYSEKYDKEKICNLVGWHVILTGFTIALLSIIRILLVGTGFEKIITDIMFFMIVVLSLNPFFRRKSCLK